MTAEFTADRLKFAMLPGAKEALLKTLRSGLNWRGVRLAHVDAISAALPMLKIPTLVITSFLPNTPKCCDVCSPTFRSC